MKNSMKAIGGVAGFERRLDRLLNRPGQRPPGDIWEE